MDKYEVLLEKHRAAASEAEQLALVKDYMLSLSPDELKKFLFDDTVSIIETMMTLGKDGLEAASHSIDLIKGSLEKPKMSRKAA